MKNPFPDNEVFGQFLGLKNYFRQYTTRESFTRTRELAKIARIIQRYGDTISFDILGSLNFGISDEKSDVDMVIYLDCEHEREATYENCYKLWFYQTLIINTLVYEVSEKRYQIEVVDTINLSKLQKAIESRDYDDDILARFVFYRTICRGINKKAIRQYEHDIMNDKALFRHIEEKLTDALVMFTTTSGHSESFRKYIRRLQDKELQIPHSMIEKIRNYLNISGSQGPSSGETKS